MEQREEIDICINLINLIQNDSISNEEILSFISVNDYLNKAKVLDKQIEGVDGDAFCRSGTVSEGDNFERCIQ